MTGPSEEKRSEISPEERALRQEALEYARASIRLEGFVLSDFAEDIYRQYIDGEISLKDVRAQIDAHHEL